MIDPSLVFAALADAERLRLLRAMDGGACRRNSIADLSAALERPPRTVRQLLRGLHRAGAIDDNAGGAVRAPALDATLLALWKDLVMSCCIQPQNSRHRRRR